MILFAALGAVPQLHEGLFDRIVEATGLHPAVGPFTVRRLLMRAGLSDPSRVTPADLEAALPLFAAGLERFLETAEFRRALQTLRALANASRP